MTNNETKVSIHIIFLSKAAKEEQFCQEAII